MEAIQNINLPSLCTFRAKPNTDSGANRTLIPGETER